MNMTSQLNFESIFCTSEQPGFEAKNLERSFHNTAGWKSQKYPLYPIEIILKFADPVVSLNEMQFLVDPNLKPYRIDLWSYSQRSQHNGPGNAHINVLDQNLPEAAIDLRSANFQYQGEIKFGSRDNNVRDDGGTKYYKPYRQNM